MAQEYHACISLKLAGPDGPIAGLLIHGTREIAFTGWLALAAALESARGMSESIAAEQEIDGRPGDPQPRGEQ